MASLTRELHSLVDAELTVPDSLPETLGRYRIEAIIGQGAMGVVYRAIDPVIDRRVALKVVRLPFAATPEDRAQAEQRFLREATLAGNLSHPNTVVVHDFGWDPQYDVPFIALEYLEGRTLTDVIAHGPRPDWKEALRITSRLADALGHAHAQGVVHRDVKPANVMLLPSGEPKILDFGIACTSSAALTGAADTWGTPSYMSPEQVTGGVVDARSDLFALGTLCFEMLTGQAAWQGENVPQIVSRIAFQEPPRASRLVPALPEEVDVILSRALARDPRRRYPNALSFTEDIAALLADQALPDRPGLGNPPLAGDDTTRHRVVTATKPAVPVRARSLRRGLLLAAATLLAFLAAQPSLRSVPAVPASEALAATPTQATARSAFNFPAPPPTIAWAAAAPPAATRAPAPLPVAADASEAMPTTGFSTARLPGLVPARVAIAIEHGLEQGHLRVWVDGRPSFEKALASKPTKRLLVFKRRSGAAAEVVDVPPGDHVLRFEVVGGGVVRRGVVRSQFESNRTRLLRVKVQDRTLELSWRS
ncbi:MAG: serine/threonine-protein kinase [Vicinamibacteria bacterium]